MSPNAGEALFGLPPLQPPNVSCDIVPYHLLRPVKERSHFYKWCIQDHPQLLANHTLMVRGTSQSAADTKRVGFSFCQAIFAATLLDHHALNTQAFLKYMIVIAQRNCGEILIPLAHELTLNCFPARPDCASEDRPVETVVKVGLCKFYFSVFW